MNLILKYTLILLLVGSKSLFANSEQSDLIRQDRSVTSFIGVSVSSGINLEITQINKHEVTVETNEKLINKVETRVEAGILKVYLSELNSINKLFLRSPINVFVSMPEVNRIEASSGSDIRSTGAIKADKLKLDAGSGADIKLEIDANELLINSGSGSDITVWGTANLLKANASAGSDIAAAELRVKDCYASVSSGSDIIVHVSGSLDANANSGGDITYLGNPAQKTLNKSSGANIKGR